MRKWTLNEVNELKRMRKENLQFDEIAKKIGRTENACKLKSMQEGFGIGRGLMNFWTHDEIDILKKMCEENVSFNEIALKLKRTENACRGRAIQEGFGTSRVRVVRKVSDAEKDALRKLYEKGISITEIARRLERSVKTCRYIANRMGFLSYTSKFKKKRVDIYKNLQ